LNGLLWRHEIANWVSQRLSDTGNANCLGIGELLGIGRVMG
jgi:hypothetical protein